MQLIALTLVFALFVSGCAHHSTRSGDGWTNRGTGSSDSNDDQEEQVIKQLPKGEGDLGEAQSIQMPVEINREVEQWIGYFQGKGHDYMERYLQRSAQYMPLMKKILRQNGMPEQLIYLALIESGFSSKIKSRAGAVGFWQFMPGTGKHYGLKRNRWIDERSDPVRSTEAAAAYLKGLYNLFGNWYLAIASYNVGENRIKNLVMKYETRNFWELARQKKLPVETQHYIPKFIAAGLIAQEPEKYGFVGVDYRDEMKFENFTITENVDLSKFAEGLSVDYHKLADMNPQFRTHYAPASQSEPVTIRIPEGKHEAAKVVYEASVVKDKRFVATASDKPAGYKRHRVRRGETLEAIANKYDLSEEDILKANRWRSPKRLRPGMSLKIPAFKNSDSRNSTSISRKNMMADARRVHSVLPRLHVVKKGETLMAIARHYRLTVTRLARANKLTSRSQIQIGQRLMLPPSKI